MRFPEPQKHNGITIRKKAYSLLRHFWTILENSFLNNVLPSSSMVFSISAADLTTSSYFVSSLFNPFIFLMPSPKPPFFTGAIVTIYPGFLFLVSKASRQYRVSLWSLLYRYFFCMEKAMLQIPICFSSLVSNIKPDLLAILDFYRLNWKSETSLSFSKTIFHFHRLSYHTASTPINLWSFAQVTASIISALSLLLSMNT